MNLLPILVAHFSLFGFIPILPGLTATAFILLKFFHAGPFLYHSYFSMATYNNEQFCPYGRAGWPVQKNIRGLCKGRQSSGTNKCVRSTEHLMPVHELVVLM
jgi:hypothetical protein